MSARRGATLIEALVGCAVFAFLMLSSIAILNIGAGGYRVVEAKTDVTRQLNRFEADLVQELRRASLRSVGIYTPTDDFHWAVWMKTPMNAPGCFDPTSGNVLRLGDPLLQVTNAATAKMQRYVLFYVTRMSAAEHSRRYGYLCASYASSGGPDVTCPHKWIVRKDIYMLDGKTSGNDTIGLQSDTATAARVRAFTNDATVTEQALNAEAEGTVSTSVIHRVQVVAQNVLSFEVTRLGLSPTDPLQPPTVRASGPIVLFDVKVFKTLDAGKIRVGSEAAASVQMTTSSGMSMVDASATVDAQGTTVVHTSSSVVPTFGSFTVQVDNRVIPQNP